MSAILKKIESTFDNHSKGYSARKLTAFVFVVVSVVLCFKYTTPDNLNEVLISIFVFIAFCLGLITVQNIINFKNGTTTDSNSTDNDKLQGDKTE